MRFRRILSREDGNETRAWRRWRSADTAGLELLEGGEGRRNLSVGEGGAGSSCEDEAEDGPLEDVLECA